MKAVCLLLCLVLPNDITGSIFEPQLKYYLGATGLNFQPLEYIGQQQQQQSQKTEQWQRDRAAYQQQHQSQYPPVEQNKDVKRHSSESNSQETSQQININSDVYAQPLQSLVSKRPHNSNSRSSESYSQETRNSQEGGSININDVSRKPTESLESLVRKQRRGDSNSKSSSSESNSRETKGRIDIYDNTQYYGPPNTRPRQWSSSLSSDVNNRMAYGDAITWNGVQMAVGPKSPAKSKRDIEKIYKDAYNTMKRVNSDNKRKFHEEYEAAAQTGNEDVHLNATQLLQKYNYQVEEHTVKTEDGYYLTLFRISQQQRKRDVQKRQVVFLMHGLLGSADDWLLMGPKKSLAYLLADAGYDVWLGNARGNKYSRRHASKHPAQHDYWHFSTDEIALQDLPTMIDYALKTSNQQKLYYVGHSQGATAYFALASTRPEYNDKIIMMYALSPMAYMSNVRSPLFRMIAPNSQFYDSLVKYLRHGQFKPSKELINTVGGSMCEKEIGCKKVCSNVYFVVSGVNNVDDLEMSLIPVIMGHLPAGGSTRQMKQYGQAVASHEFRKYDFGPEINQQVYGKPEPPSYKMEKVSTPVALYYSEDDWLAHPKDVKRLQKELPNVKDSYKVPQEHFGSMDFQFSKKAPEVVYQRLIESIQQNQSV